MKTYVVFVIDDPDDKLIDATVRSMVNHAMGIMQDIANANAYEVLFGPMPKVKRSFIGTMEQLIQRVFDK